MKPKTLGELKRLGESPPAFRSVRDEIRGNLLKKLAGEEDLFPGMVGYEDSVVPELVNALLSRQNLILLGLRGQGKSRILRALTDFLDDEIPAVQGCEIHDDPFFPLCAACKRRLEEEGDNLPLSFVPRQERYIEKLATPDVTIADIIGDLDPIKAARQGKSLSALENIHFGLLPRAHRGIFAINELPDLAPKIQVGLFNILQEGDIQIKGFPIRLPLDILMVFSANPEDYTARGKIITPLKDRIGSEVRTHYPGTIEEGIAITMQEAWTERLGGRPVNIPNFVKEVVEGVAIQGRQNKRVDVRSGVSQRLPISCLEVVISNAERRALRSGENSIVPRVSDIYASIPAITGKLELEYEGELKGSRELARELIQSSLLNAFARCFPDSSFDPIVQWFDLGGEIKVSDQTSSREFLGQVGAIQGIDEILKQAGADPAQDLPLAASLVEFVLEGLHARKKLNRSEERGFFKDLEPEDRKFQEGEFTVPRQSFN